jgi:hypothetical protein
VQRPILDTVRDSALLPVADATVGISEFV